jgi:hypothetical protein
MTLRLSTKLRNMMLGGVPAIDGATIAGTTLAAASGSPDTFTDSGNGFVTAGFQVGDTICVSGFLAAANNGIFTVTIVAAGTLSISETSVTGEVAGPNVKIQVIKGGSLKDVFKDGVLKIYSGSQPATADAAITGSLLCTITVSSGAWAAGSPQYGLEFGTASSGAISKASGDVWSGTNAATGTAGYFRLYANATDAGAVDTSTYPRIDGAIATSGSQLNLSSTSLVSGATLTIDTFTITFPAA